MKHLNEAVAKRTAGKYSKYDLEPWETKEGIIGFLEEKGFVEINAQKASTIIGESKILGDVPVYAVGDYTSDPVTHWIKFYSPKWKNRVFFCRENNIIDRIDTKSTSIWSVILGIGWNDFKDFDSFRDTVREKLGI